VGCLNYVSYECFEPGSEEAQIISDGIVRMVANRYLKIDRELRGEIEETKESETLNAEGYKNGLGTIDNCVRGETEELERIVGMYEKIRKSKVAQWNASREGARENYVKQADGKRAEFSDAYEELRKRIIVLRHHDLDVDSKNLW
jgi:hypothetical protein